MSGIKRAGGVRRANTDFRRREETPMSAEEVANVLHGRSLQRPVKPKGYFKNEGKPVIKRAGGLVPTFESAPNVPVYQDLRHLEHMARQPAPFMSGMVDPDDQALAQEWAAPGDYARQPMSQHVPPRPGALRRSSAAPVEPIKRPPAVPVWVVCDFPSDYIPSLVYRQAARHDLKERNESVVRLNKHSSFTRKVQEDPDGFKNALKGVKRVVYYSEQGEVDDPPALQRVLNASCGRTPVEVRWYDDDQLESALEKVKSHLSERSFYSHNTTSSLDGVVSSSVVDGDRDGSDLESELAGKSDGGDDGDDGDDGEADDADEAVEEVVTEPEEGGGGESGKEISF
jgi:hypothetical protein